jgi:acyl-CoA synthetase (AMP-forming)/AMP-acid ligase II
MFHCNGWCTPWAVTAIGGTHVCLREVRGDAIWKLIKQERVTHLNGAPTVVTTVMNAEQAKRLDYQLVITTAGAPPSPNTILQTEKMGFRIVHVMAGYFEDLEGTEKAFAGGWFHSGDLAVMHPDGYIEVRDRAKDVVVSGGENISTIEVEQAMLSHPDVLEVAVIGIPDEEWGEVPKAFVVLRQGEQVEEDELIKHVKTKIARYKAPKAVEVVDELPKTSTGKVQKFELREKERASTV